MQNYKEMVFVKSIESKACFQIQDKDVTPKLNLYKLIQDLSELEQHLLSDSHKLTNILKDTS